MRRLALSDVQRDESEGEGEGGGGGAFGGRRKK